MVSQKRLLEIVGNGIYNEIPVDQIELLDITHDRKWDGKYRGSNILPKGGHTVANLKIGGDEFFGISKCSNKDNFCKKEGRKFAVKRAFIQYWNNQ